MNFCSHHRTRKSSKKLILVFNMERIYTIFYFHSQLLPQKRVLVYTLNPLHLLSGSSKKITTRELIQSLTALVVLLFFFKILLKKYQKINTFFTQSKMYHHCST